MSEGAHLRLDGLRKAFGRTTVLHGLDLAVARGEMLALLGPSGCGKTTVLRIIAGLLAPEAGDVVLDGRSIGALPPHRRDMGVVFQSYALFPHMTVHDNVRFGLEMRGLRRSDADRRVGEALARVQLKDHGARHPGELSGGQQQRVALARAIVIRPRLLLLDEPLSNLDAMLRAAMRVDVRALHLETGQTTILVTHDQTEAMTMADRIAVLRDGRIEQIGTPQEIYEDPASAFVATFVGSPPAALVRLIASDNGTWRVGTQLWRPQPPLARVLAGVKSKIVLASLRPERLQLGCADAPYALKGTVAAVEFLGADQLVHVHLDDQHVLVRCEAGQALPNGRVGVLAPDAVPLFDPTQGKRICAASTTA